MRRGYNDPIRELDMELELLKRKRQVLYEKRQIIEEQRQFDQIKQHQQSPWAMDSGLGQFAHSTPTRTFNYQSPNFRNKNSNRGGHESNRGTGLKRPAGPVNQWNPPVKRFAGPSRGGAVPRPPVNVPNTFTNRPAVPKHQPPQKKSTPALNDQKYNVIDKKLMLEENVPVCNQLMGRIELVLGNILKALKTELKDPPYNKIIFETVTLSAVKQRIRERLRNALLGKYVTTNMTQNMAYYRTLYPKETDTELIEIMTDEVKASLVEIKDVFPKDTERKAETKQSKPAGFRKYLRMHFDRICKEKIDEIFVKFKKCVDEENKSLVEPTKDNEDEPSTPTENAKKDAMGKLTPEEAEMEKNVEFLIRRKLNDILPEYKNNMKEILKETGIINDILNAYKKSLIIDKERSAASSANPQENSGEKAAESRPKMFMAKVTCVPGLPNRTTMTTFLHSFNCTFIKKYKKKHNILIVGFYNEENYTKILEANKTTLGDSIIYMTGLTRKINKNNTSNDVQDKTIVTDNEENTNTIESETLKEDVKEEKNSEELAINQKNDLVGIDAKIENAIDDLLATINQDNESDKAKVKIEEANAKIKVDIPIVDDAGAGDDGTSKDVIIITENENDQKDEDCVMENNEPEKVKALIEVDSKVKDASVIIDESNSAKIDEITVANDNKTSQDEVNNLTKDVAADESEIVKESDKEKNIKSDDEGWNVEDKGDWDDDDDACQIIDETQQNTGVEKQTSTMVTRRASRLAANK